MSPESTRTLTDADFQRLLAFRTGLRRFLHWSEEQAAAAGLTAAQHQLLLVVRGSTEPGPTIGEVAEALLLRHHSTVGLVDRAAKAGLVDRREDTVDRRVVRLRLTSLGEELLGRLSAAHLEELERMAPAMRTIWDLPKP